MVNFTRQPLFMCALFCFSLSLFGQSTDLIISEYVEGSSYNKYIEIFNHTNASVDLSNYSLELYSNGASSSSQSVSLGSSSFASGDVIVLAHGSASVWSGSPDIISSAVCNFNGDDAIVLKKNSTIIDIFGVIGDDPGSAWTGDGGYSTLDKTLVRKQSVTSGITTNPSGTGASAFTTLTTEWDVYNLDDVSHLGAHTVDHSLPVELTSFTATSGGGKVILQWITESEIENLGFLLERRAESAEHGAWETVADYKTNGALTGQGSVTHRTEYKYTDEKVRVGQTYAYLLVDVDYHGQETRHDPVSITVHAWGITMTSAYPNPFNPVTKFTVIVGDPQHLSINIYDITGRLVKTLTNERVPAGEHIIAWDGTNGNNQAAASGIYFICLVTNGTTNIQKVVLTR